MKNGLIQKGIMGLLVCGLPLGALSGQETPAPASPADPSSGASTVPNAVAPAGPALLPASVPAYGPLSELIKLANSGVDESVLLAYVINSTQLFNLSAEQIIYLNDIGVSAPVVTAVLQHDQQLKTELANQAGAQAAAAPPAPAPAPMPDTQSAPMPPPPDYSAGAAPVEAPLTPPDEAVSDAGFYDSLAPYGAWVDINGYGRCWQPTVTVLNPGWQPYFDGGHWAYTDCGWYWLSDYSWGWAPFHYGRWFRDGHLGWCWAPDKVWGPSWVSWRYSDAYCGWAPLPPGCNFSFAGGLTFHGRRVGERDDFGLDRRHYRFVAWGDFEHRRLRDHALGAERVDRIFNSTVVANRFDTRNHTVVNQGISAARVAAATHSPVPRLALHQVSVGRQFVGRTERLDPARRTLTVYHPPEANLNRPGSAQAPRTLIPPRPVRSVETMPARVATPGFGQTAQANPPAAPRQGTVLYWHGPANSSANSATVPQVPQRPVANAGFGSAQPGAQYWTSQEVAQNPTPWAMPARPMENQGRWPAAQQQAPQTQTYYRNYQPSWPSQPQAQQYSRPAQAEVPRYNNPAPERSYAAPTRPEYQAPAPRAAAPESPRYAPAAPSRPTADSRSDNNSGGRGR
ncbi:MAG TPA: DUF6600 domain-containing protein [Verrucomicrobiae bacterium]|nr:DUF6600 domain-containing protein [Verrucomicrobiae bacterium]